MEPATVANEALAHDIRARHEFRLALDAERAKLHASTAKIEQVA